MKKSLHFPGKRFFFLKKNIDKSLGITEDITALPICWEVYEIPNHSEIDKNYVLDALAEQKSYIPYVGTKTLAEFYK